MAEGVRKTLGYAKYGAGNNNVVRKCADTPGGTGAVGAAAPGAAYGMLIQVESQAIRWRDDGGDPSAADGMLISPSSPSVGAASFPAMYEGDIDKFRWIEVSAGAIVHISYYGMG